MKTKRLFILPTFLGLLIMFIYCNIYMSIEKPSCNYYISTLSKKLESLSSESDYHITMISTDYYSMTDLKDESKKSVSHSLKSFNTLKCNPDTFSDEKNPRFKYIITFSDEKFIVDVYDSKILTVYEWDGAYKKDILSMEECYPYENLYAISQYIYGYQ